jgi:hypothetical protein
MGHAELVFHTAVGHSPEAVHNPLNYIGAQYASQLLVSAGCNETSGQRGSSSRVLMMLQDSYRQWCSLAQHSRAQSSTDASQLCFWRTAYLRPRL